MMKLDCHDCLAVRIIDDLDPEQAEIVIDFLEAVLDTLHRNYDLSIIQLQNDRRDECRPVPARRIPSDDDLPF
jgi:hypothetical protein